MPAATPDIARPRPQTSSAQLRAFGLDLEAGFDIPGLVPEAVPAPAGRRVRLELATRAEILGGWNPVAPERISKRQTANGRIVVSIDEDAEAGYLIRAQGFGCFWIARDASLVRCAPLQVSPWRWQRYLIGQVLPLLAVLHGLEVFHASAVVLDGRAIAFLGASTAGKTSLAVSLLLRGATFMTDDVLAVSPGDGGGVVAHPGMGVASLRHTAAETLDPEQRRRLGRRLGRDQDASRVELPRHGSAATLGAAYIVERRSHATELRIERLRPVDPRLLLGGSFNFIIRTPERLTNQLDVCARLARTVDVCKVTIPPRVGPAEVAAAVELQARAG